ncbi:MAG: type II toxin-antitoxin system RelE/ParE family toxin [Sedimenticolaceae bacterium]
MVFLETSVFTKSIQSLLSDEEYRWLQNHLVRFPEAGDLIKGSGGLRKIRWKLEGRGKRGGVRVIYYWATSDDQLFMLFAYAKNEQGDLTKEQLLVLKKLVETEFGK